MAQPKSKIVYICDGCGREHDSTAAATQCEKEDKARKEFVALVGTYKTLQADVRKLCRHKSYKVLCSENTVDFTDSRVTEYTKHCSDCDRVWKDNHY